jgi:hypothetical protein
MSRLKAFRMFTRSLSTHSNPNKMIEQVAFPIPSVQPSFNKTGVIIVFVIVVLVLLYLIAKQQKDQNNKFRY